MNIEKALKYDRNNGGVEREKNEMGKKKKSNTSHFWDQPSCKVSKTRELKHKSPSVSCS